MSLAEKFSLVGLTIFAVIESARALTSALHSMTEHQEDVGQYLRTFKLISDQLYSLSLKASEAIEQSSIALHK